MKYRQLFDKWWKVGQGTGVQLSAQCMQQRQSALAQLLIEVRVGGTTVRPFTYCLFPLPTPCRLPGPAFSSRKRAPSTTTMSTSGPASLLPGELHCYSSAGSALGASWGQEGCKVQNLHWVHQHAAYVKAEGNAGCMSTGVRASICAELHLVGSLRLSAGPIWCSQWTLMARCPCPRHDPYTQPKWLPSGPANGPCRHALLALNTF